MEVCLEYSSIDTYNSDELIKLIKIQGGLRNNQFDFDYNKED